MPFTLGKLNTPQLDCAPSHTLPLTENILGTPSSTIDNASPQSANGHHPVVTRGLPPLAGRVSKQPSSADIGLRYNQRARRRFSIERCLKLVRGADSSTHNSRAQRLSIAKEHTDLLLKSAMNHAYRYLGSNEPNLPDITPDGLEAIVNDLVHTINVRDPSRGLRTLGGRLGGQLLDSALARGLEGYTKPCEQDAEFDPVVQLSAWHTT